MPHHVCLRIPVQEQHRRPASAKEDVDARSVHREAISRKPFEHAWPPRYRGSSLPLARVEAACRARRAFSRGGGLTSTSTRQRSCKRTNVPATVERAREDPVAEVVLVEDAPAWRKQRQSSSGPALLVSRLFPSRSPLRSSRGGKRPRLRSAVSHSMTRPVSPSSIGRSHSAQIHPTGVETSSGKSPSSIAALSAVRAPFARRFLPPAVPGSLHELPETYPAPLRERRTNAYRPRAVKTMPPAMLVLLGKLRAATPASSPQMRRVSPGMPASRGLHGAQRAALMVPSAKVS
jgi:hypothetical protein